MLIEDEVVGVHEGSVIVEEYAAYGHLPPLSSRPW